MPVVSINLTRQAYEEYQLLNKGTRSARVSYLLCRNGFNTSVNIWEDCPRCRGVVSPPVQLGDMRTTHDGLMMKWTLSGWLVIE